MYTEFRNVKLSTKSEVLLKFGRLYCFATIRVNLFVFLFADPPEIEVERSWVHSGEGYEAQLVCIVHGEPAPEVSPLFSVSIKVNSFFHRPAFPCICRIFCLVSNFLSYSHIQFEMVHLPPFVFHYSSTLVQPFITSKE